MGNRKTGRAGIKAAAADMDLMLRMLQSGVARFEPGTGEFCFDGMRYSARRGDWSSLMDVVGRRGAEDAVAKAAKENPHAAL